MFSLIICQNCYECTSYSTVPSPIWHVFHEFLILCCYLAFACEYCNTLAWDNWFIVSIHSFLIQSFEKIIMNKNKHVLKHQRFQHTLLSTYKIYFSIQGKLQVIFKHSHYSIFLWNSTSTNRRTDRNIDRKYRRWLWPWIYHREGNKTFFLSEIAIYLS